MKRILTLLALAAAATTFASAQQVGASGNPAYGPVNVAGLSGQVDAGTTDAGARTYVRNTDPRSGPVGMQGWPDATKGTDATGRSHQVDMPNDGKCQGVRAGDIVHFTLRVEGVADARRLYTQLAMGLGSHPKFVKTDFMLSTSDSFGGGGMGTRDGADPQLFHFRFVVPNVRSGIYHSASIGVQAIYSDSSVDEGKGVGLNRHAHNQVRRYCLAVFGGEGGEHRPVVTEFLPGEIEHAASAADRPIFR